MHKESSLRTTRSINVIVRAENEGARRWCGGQRQLIAILPVEGSLSTCATSDAHLVFGSGGGVAGSLDICVRTPCWIGGTETVTYANKRSNSIGEEEVIVRLAGRLVDKATFCRAAAIANEMRSRERLDDLVNDNSPVYIMSDVRKPDLSHPATIQSDKRRSSMSQRPASDRQRR